MIGQLSRRALLGSTIAGSALLVVGCSEVEVSPQPDRDETLRKDVASAEQVLISAYDATIATYPALAPRLRAFRNQHLEHLESMDVTQPSTTTPAPVVPNTAKAAVQALTAAELQAAAQRAKSCEGASNADLAWALALIGASEASHAEFLARRVLR